MNSWDLRRLINVQLPDLPKREEVFNDTYARMYGDENKAKTITFSITEECPLRCSYCYVHKKSSKKMSKETAKKCLEFLFASDETNSEYINSKDTNGIIIEFIGGEPTAALDLMEYTVDEFLRMCIEKNHRWAFRYMVSFTTNGVYCDTPEFKRFIKKYEGKVSFCVTVDGNKELHDSCRVFPDGSGSYIYAESAFNMAREMFGVQNTKLTISPENLEHLETATKHMFEVLNVPYLQGNCVFEDVWKPEHAVKLYAILKNIADWLLTEKRYLKHAFTFFDPYAGFPKDESDNQNYCGGNMKMMSFDTDGNIYPCFRYGITAMPDGVEPYSVGHVDRGIGITETEKTRLSVLDSITRRSQSTDECFYCPIASGCAWCSAYNYELYGTPDKRTVTTCQMHKARSLATTYYWNKLFLDADISVKFPLNTPKEWALEIIDQDEYNMLVELSKEA